MAKKPEPYLVQCLAELRAEFNELNPNRDKASDGWIGDPAHQDTNSDHNPDKTGAVRAIDVDSTGPWPDGMTFSQAIEILRFRHHDGRDYRLQHVIYDRRIAGYFSDWKWVPYQHAAKDPHIKHAHISARHDGLGWGSTQHFFLEDAMISPESVAAIAAEVRKSLLAAELGSSGPTVAVALQSGAYLGSRNSLAAIGALATEVGQLDAKVDDILAKLDGGTVPAGTE